MLISFESPRIANRGRSYPCSFTNARIYLSERQLSKCLGNKKIIHVCVRFVTAPFQTNCSRRLMSSDVALFAGVGPNTSERPFHVSKSDENERLVGNDDHLSIPGTPDPFDLYTTPYVKPLRPEGPVESQQNSAPILISLEKEIVHLHNPRSVKSVSLFDALRLNQQNKTPQSLTDDLGLESSDQKS